MSTNYFTLQNARDFVKRFVETGTCVSETIDARINEACRRLLVKADWPHTTKIIRARTDNRYFPLPRECEKVISARICNTSAHVYNQSYEFLSSGPGDIRVWMDEGTGIKELVDAGEFPTMYDIPTIESFADDAKSCVDRTLAEGHQIVAFSEFVEDASLSLTVQGLNKYNMDHQLSGVSGFVPGESFLINRWYGGVEGALSGSWVDRVLSTNRYRQITALKKPVTKGYITVYAVNTVTNDMYLLAKIHPDDTAPVWRRYHILNQQCTDDCANILALVKLKSVTLTRPDDILPIQNLDAIKMMVICIREENASNLPVALQYESNAVRLLTEQKAEHDTTGGNPVILDVEAELWGGQINRPRIM